LTKQNLTTTSTRYFLFYFSTSIHRKYSTFNIFYPEIKIWSIINENYTKLDLLESC